MIVNHRFTAGVAAGLLCLSAARSAAAQAAPADPDLELLQARVDTFFEGISVGGGTRDAYRELLAGSPLLNQAKEIDALVARTDQLSGRYGPYRDFEPIAARRVGKDLVLLRYLYKCEQFPVVFYFTFYRTPRGEPPGETGNNWRIITVRFDTDLELLALMPEAK